MDLLSLAASIMYALVVIVIVWRLYQIDKRLVDIRRKQLVQIGIEHGIEAINRAVKEERK
jgi:hypothetical protein